MGLLGCSVGGTTHGEAPEDPAAGIEQTGEGIVAPQVTDDADTPTGTRTQWACVTFGSCPQTEIVRGPFDAVDAYAHDASEVVEDPALFDELERADWTGGECVVGGERYRRVTAADATSWTTDEPQRYRWSDADERHYFRYDPVVWRVGALDGTCALLVADRLLDCVPFNADERPTTWQDSTMRSWLNGLGARENACGTDFSGSGFADLAFSDAERRAISVRTVTNAPNGHYGTSSGPDTEDQVFLLSADEVFASERAAELGFYAGTGVDDPARRFRSTMYAKCRGAWWSPMQGYRGNSYWLMRTAGYAPTTVSYICDFGYVYQRGTEVACTDAGVLPALWCDLAKAGLKATGTVSSTDVIEAGTTGADASQDEQTIAVDDPEVTPDEDEPDGKRVFYSTLAFGSYPQTEIVGDEDGKGNVAVPGATEVNAALAAALADADWVEDETTIEGQRYLRARGEEGMRYFRIDPIVWRVLEVQDDVALLFSERALDCAPFDETQAKASWETCTLRAHLNGQGHAPTGDAGLLARAFTPEEQAAILWWPTRNLKNHYFRTDCGQDTADAVFLLSESEVFGTDDAERHGFARGDATRDRQRQLTPTGYALYRGCWASSTDDTAGKVAWMLRTSGYTQGNVVYVNEGGCILNRGMPIGCPDLAVVPAIRVDLDRL